MMRKILGVAAFALAVGPAMAADLPAAYPAAPPPSGSPVYSSSSLITGDVTLALGWTGSDSKANGDSFSGLVGGRVNIPFGNGWNEELEASGLWGFDNNSHVAGVFSHTYYKNQGWASGFVLGATGSDLFSSSSTVYTAGVEGVVFMPNVSVVGKLTYNWADSAPDFWSISTEGRYYFDPNTKVTGALAYSNEGSSDNWLFSAALEHRWTATPFSTFASLAYMPSSGPDRWAALVGFRYLFDQPNGTLQSHDFEVPFSGITQGLQL